jgi:tetratricopeptide (TPR) repeat protein
MAPEQRRSQVVDARADQFSFCVMLYEALCGELPAPADGRPGDDPTAAGPAYNRLPARLRRILSRGLAADPAERFPAMRQLLDALDALLQRRRGRLLGLAAVVVALTLTAGVVQWAAVAPPAPCADPGRALAGVWGPAQERMLRRVFLSSGLGGGQEAWRRLASQLDAYTGRWIEARRTACEATHVHGEQSAELMDLRMACLDRRKRQLAAVIDLLAEGQPSALSQSDRLAGSLRGLSECEDTHRLLAYPTPPADADSQRWMGETEQRLARARALEVTGHFGEALAVSREALAAGERSNYPPLLAEAQIRVAIARGRAGDLEAYRQGLLAAARYAQAHHSQAEVAVAFTYLILNAVLRGEPQEAEQWNLLAEGAIEGFGGIPELDAYRYMCMSQLYLQQERFTEAQAALQASLEVHPEPGLLELGYAQLNQGRALMGLGRLEEAGEQLDLAMESLLAAEGPGSGGVLSLHQLRGDLELQRGDPAAAEAHYRRSLSGLHANGNPDNLESALALSGLGRSLLEQDRPAEAKAILQRATRAWRGGDPADRGDAHFLLARACRRLGEVEDARREAQEARQAYAAAGERTTERLAATDAWIAELRLSP